MADAHPPAGELPGGQGVRRASRARRTEQLGVRPGPRRADHVQRPLSRDGDRLPEGPHGAGERQPPLHAARGRRSARVREAASGHLPPGARREIRRRAGSLRRRTAHLGRRRQRRADIAGAIALDDAVAQGDPDARIAGSPDDLIMYCTGGTTGRPKGVLWRQSDTYVSSMVGADHESPAEIHDKVRATTGRRGSRCRR